jgi:hypothetical protein
MRPLPLALLLAAFLLTSPPSGVSSSEAPVIHYPAAADFQVLEIRLAIPLTPDAREGPAVRIYGDGRVVQHRPSYMKGSGDYEAWISHADLDRLLRFVAERGVMAFDPERVKDQQFAAARDRVAATGSEPVIADAPTTILNIDLEAFAPAGAEHTQDYAKTVVWYALDEVVSWYPDVVALKNLHEVASVLWSLGERAEAAAGKKETLITLPVLSGSAS